MIVPETLIVFAAASLVLNLTPGPDMLYAVSRGVSHGWRGSSAAAVGNLAGSLAHTALAVAGLSAVLVASATAFSIVKLAGAAYLIFMGVRMLMARGSASRDVDAHASIRRIARESFLIHTLNPKVAVFFLAFLPQFVDGAAGGTGGQLLILGLWFTGQAALVLALVGGLAGESAARLPMVEPLGRMARRLAGTLFVVLGARLAAATGRL